MTRSIHTVTIFKDIPRYSDFREAYKAVLKNVLEHGNDLPEQKCYEIFGIAYGIDNPKPSIDLLRIAQISKKWGEKEFEERVSGKAINPGDAWKEWKEFWKSKLVDGKKFDYTYAERYSKQLSSLIDKLKNNPTTRRGILLVYFPEDINQHGRVPCTVFKQFFIRKNKLHMTDYLRSSDVVNLLPADMYLASKFQQWLANKVGTNSGSFINFIASCHIYYTDVDKAKKILEVL